jgi:hypothetical protein
MTGGGGASGAPPEGGASGARGVSAGRGASDASGAPPEGGASGTRGVPAGRGASGGGAAPPPPWRSRVDALLWWHRAAPAAHAALPSTLAERRLLSVTVGGLIAYREGPVGPYAELVGAPLVLRGALPHAHVAFMAVDSRDSMDGGRRNWALPKELARFADGPGGVVATGDGWAVSVRAVVRPRGVPVAAVCRCRQVREDGGEPSFLVRVRGWARPASVVVRHEAPSPLGAWLLPGRHPAVLFSGTQVVGSPRAV